MKSVETTYPVVCFGETLWDILPQEKLPGGAPMNVAYHLTRLGKHPAIISRIGSDEPGKELLSIFERKGIDINFFQVDKKYSTGKVYAAVKENHEMQYDIVKPVAWDFIQWGKKLADILTAAEYFVFGSLATRSSQSKNTLFKCLEAANTKVLDINMRPPFYSRKAIEELLQKADVLKLNLEELYLVTGWFSNYENDDDRIRLLRDKFDLKIIIVTKGSQGATLNIGDNFFHHPGYKVIVADTVGSGDSFLAAVLSKFLDKASPEDALNFACALGALVASKRGGCPEYDLTDLYKLFAA